MMAKQGVEPMRRRAMIEAAVLAIHARGSLDVTVAEIARRAGYSSALAHHYFGTKDDLLLAAMRHLLVEFGRDARRGLRGQRDGRKRVSAILTACFGGGQFRPETVSAWLAFYMMAQRHPQAQRLLRVYFSRLQSNLSHALRPLAADRAPEIAEGAGAMVDGLYLRHGLSDLAPDAVAAIRAVETYVSARLAA